MASTLTGDPILRMPGSRRAIGPSGGKYATATGSFTTHVDAEQLRLLGIDVYRAAALLEIEAVKTLTVVGTKIWADAAQIAASNGSRTIPQSMRGGMVGRYEYRIRAGGNSAPMAGLWELGNRENRRTRIGFAGPSGRLVSAETAAAGGETFYHPVYGNKSVQVAQPRYPFFRPALRKNRYLLTKELWQMWERVLGPFRMNPVG